MVFEAMLIGGAISTVSKLVEADRMDTRAEKVNIKAFEKAAQAEEMVRKQHEKVQLSLQKLINRKRGIYKTSMQSFLALYKDIQKINFTEGEGIRELSQTSLTPMAMEEIKEMTGVACSQLSDTQSFATYIFTGIGGLIKKESEMNLSAANIRNKQASVIEKQSENICIALEAVGKRAEKMAEVLMYLNVLFMKSLQYTSEIVVRNGTDKSKYSTSDREALRTCFNFAKVIKDILDVPLLDEEGEITKKSIEVIQAGESYLAQMK